MRRSHFLPRCLIVVALAVTPTLGAAREPNGVNPALSALIARDVAAAKAGGVRAFRDTFSTRLTAEDFAAAGLHQKSPAELATLDAEVAEKIAAAGRPEDPLASQRFKPESTASTQGFALPKLPLEVSGSLSATYGTSRHGDFYGGAVTTTVFDPNSGWSASMGFSTLRGTLPYYPGYRRGYANGYNFCDSRW